MKNITDKSKTLIILDWDDTLFPTNWVLKNGINLTSANIRDQFVDYFQELDDVLSRLLKILTSHGKVMIITNAMPEWVELSSIVLPKTCHTLRKLKVVSARKNYQFTSDNTMDWKILAFRSEVSKEFKKSPHLNVVSIGDAEYEYNALISLIDWNSECEKLLKSIKFMKDPTHDILIDQVETLIKAVPAICKKNGHLDLKFDQHSNVKRKKHNRKNKG